MTVLFAIGNGSDLQETHEICKKLAADLNLDILSFGRINEQIKVLEQSSGNNTQINDSGNLSDESNGSEAKSDDIESDCFVDEIVQTFDPELTDQLFQAVEENIEANFAVSYPSAGIMIEANIGRSSLFSSNFEEKLKPPALVLFSYPASNFFATHHLPTPEQAKNVLEVFKFDPFEAVYASVKSSLISEGFVESGTPIMATSDRKPIIFVFGAPGSGKKTQCSKLITEFGVTHLRAGDLLRAEVKSGSLVGELCAAIMKEGKLVPLDIIITILKTAIFNAPRNSAILIDGFPRTLDQATEFERIIHPASAILNFACPYPVIETRLIERAKTSACDYDYIETVHKRFVFETESLPLIEWFGQRVITIDSSRDIETVYADSRTALIRGGVLGSISKMNVIFAIGDGNFKVQGHLLCSRLADEFNLTLLNFESSPESVILIDPSKFAANEITDYLRSPRLLDSLEKEDKKNAGYHEINDEIEKDKSVANIHDSGVFTEHDIIKPEKLIESDILPPKKFYSENELETFTIENTNAFTKSDVNFVEFKKGETRISEFDEISDDAITEMTSISKEVNENLARLQRENANLLNARQNDAVTIRLLELKLGEAIRTGKQKLGTLEQENNLLNKTVAALENSIESMKKAHETAIITAKNEIEEARQLARLTVTEMDAENEIALLDLRAKLDEEKLDAVRELRIIALENEELIAQLAERDELLDSFEEKYQEKLRILQAELSNTEQQTLTANSANDTLIKQNSHLTERLAGLNSQIEGERRERSIDAQVFASERLKLSSKIAALELTINSNSSNFAAHETLYNDLVKNHSDLIRYGRTRELQISNLQKNVTDIANERDDLQLNLRNLNEELRMSSAKIRELNDIIHAMKAQIARLVEQVRRGRAITLEDHVLKLEKTITALREETQYLKTLIMTKQKNNYEP
ncbi:hypothetical protein HK100_001908 [Physocladia obscura]|uniref:Adenylate kinase n=1 Tax=Physocladia obscura TaxID=109957 RepID=A0AAD5SYP1_9FUNG|nr:hypothetical protein HK100_001908 [Physocladia obscura]